MTRDELGRIVEEQAALRRVAMLVVRGTPPAELFRSVAGEIGRIMGAECALICRYCPDDTMVVIASWGRRTGTARPPPVGSIWSLEPDSAGSRVARTRRPARMEYDHSVSGVGLWARKHGCRSGVGCPIMVEGRLWGVVVVLYGRPQERQDNAEERMLGFTEMVSAAIANAESRDEVAASRARVVAAADATCRRIEHDLHDGVQQRIITSGLWLGEIQAGLPPGSEALREQLSRVAECLGDALDELREISHGLRPSVLSRGGIGPALKALARRSAVPVELRVRADLRLPEPAEVALYYVVSEALTNAAKHARATLVRVDLQVKAASVHVEVQDDGVGGAVFDRGSGLIGLKDRIEALGGKMDLISPIGGGTSLVAEIPADGTGPPPA